MRQSTALELRTRVAPSGGGMEPPLLVVITRRRTPESDAAVRACDQAAQLFGVDAITLDVDAADNAPLFSELGVDLVPEVLLMQRGVVVDRAPGVRDAEDAYAWIASALRKPA